MTVPVIRPLTPSDAHLFHSLQGPSLVGRAAFGHRYVPVHEGGEYRPEWTWVALRDGVVVARAAWWGGPDDTEPVLLNYFDFAEGEDAAGTELLRRAPWSVEYELIVPPAWRETPEVRAAASARIAAAEAAGMKPLVERYRYEWTTADGLPERPGRLEFREEPDDAVILDVLRRVHSETLDAHARRAVEGPGGLERAAQEELDFFRWCPSPRSWWQLAYTPEGTLAGIHVPAHNPGGPCIGFIGVVPEARGHGYGYDLLVECTRFLVEHGATSVAGATDRGNVPMARAFARAGHRITQERVHLV
ncbi:GNAT family N-acetyltransferase [Streptomyces sp. NE06-03E]|uniref:GNAT family N-acetyltransferase n=1 Tax=unclassified Streptomyces TaxID=2593676 RepID=UPI000F559097|nr:MULTISPECIES: GNAT family N-acetyltransferase [unclassified Streptomyces]MDX3055871.1 GNAT family N-acetyltransferase [Streptomyces sp. NE06-03E]MDX3683813.1 GNAT family N-acetyltransferase [Streptomyces sp. AK04-4c]RPK47417.1 Acetyltransferase (GNAT) family protein [Streptomyces sp. ADI93-02]WSS78984.1 GNAT family N-acetyltransferase [Streptomyces sp. NBC_01174]